MWPLSWAVESISSKLAFFPPSPPTYEVRAHDDGTGDLYIEPLSQDSRKVRSCHVLQIQTARRRGGGGNQTIIAAYFPYKDVKATILHSHGNAMDLGHMLLFYKELGRELRVNVMCYDYSGYGCSTGTPTVNNTYADIEAVYETLRTRFNKAPEDIVLYGQSVGSGPTAYLAAKERRLAGVVLHTPLMSGMRVLSPNLSCWPSCMDVYPNLLLVPRIEAPILTMHGSEDEVIDIHHGRTLHSLAKHAADPLWATGFDHQNLEMCPQYIPHLSAFLGQLFNGRDIVTRGPMRPPANTTTPPPHAADATRDFSRA